MSETEPSRKDKYDISSANEVKNWIESVIGEKLHSQDLIEGVKDGVALCKLVNIIIPGSAKYKSSQMPFVQMENIAAFLKASELIGVPHYELFETVDLFDERDPVQVIITLRSLSRHAHLKNPSVQVLGPKLQSPSTNRNREFNPTNIPAWNTRQYGSLEGASQGTEGVVFGGTRNIIAPKSKPAPLPPNIVIGSGKGKVSTGNINHSNTNIKTPPKPGPKPIGLSLKSTTSSSSKQNSRPISRSIFGEDVDEDEQSPSSFSGKKKNQFQEDRKRTNAQIQAQGNQQLQESEILDPSIYDYDEVYDTIKAVRDKELQTTNEGDRKAKYIDKLLESKMVRDQDRLRAKDVQLKREREAEGEEYADKEMFVTSAYKEQQEMLRKVEEEEKLKGEKDNKKNTNKFYNSILEDEDKRYNEIIEATKSNVYKKSESKPVLDVQEESNTERAKSMNEKLGYEKVKLNDSGELVDDRQLLSAGLNVKKAPTIAVKVKEPIDKPRHSYQRATERRRETELIEKQLIAQEKRKRQEEEQSKARIIQQAKSRKTEDAISSARERYLARKREQNKD